MDFSKENYQDYLDIGSHITWKKIKDTEDILFGKDKSRSVENIRRATIRRYCKN